MTHANAITSDNALKKTIHPMAYIEQLYNDNHSGDTRYRNRLKTRILEEFPDEFQFLTIDGKMPQVIVSKKSISNNIVLQDKEILIKQTASLL